MILKNEEQKIILDKLKSNGLISLSCLPEPFHDTHYERFISTIAFMKKNRLVVDYQHMEFVYAIDVVARRMIIETLKPIELGILTYLLYYLEFRANVRTIDDFFKAQLFKEKVSMSAKHKEKFEKNFDFLLSSMNGINQKNNFNNNINKVMGDFSFAQVVAVLKVFDHNIVKEILKQTTIDEDLFSTLDEIVALRNHIAHLKPIFTANGIKKYRDKFFSITKLANSVARIRGGDWKSEIFHNLKAYYDDLITLDKWSSSNIDFENVFDKLIKHILG